MSRNIIKKTFLSIILSLILGLSFYQGPASAKRAIVISPVGQRIVLVPGETYYGSVRVTNPNDSTDDLNYIVSVGSYSVNSTPTSKDDYGEADIVSSSEINEIMDWITIDNPTGVLSPNEEGTIGFTIEVPDDAPAGGQYATLLIKDNTKSEVTGTLGISESMQMATVIYAEVAGETIKKGAITENTLPSFLIGGELEATSMVKNEGNVHTDAEYVLQVWPMFSSEEICTNEEDPSTNLILPNTERYHTESCALPAIGIFRAKQTVKIFGEESIVEKTVFVCPLWLLFLIVFVVAALIIWLVVKTKSRKSAKK